MTRVSAAAALALGLAGCDVLPPLSCTEIGCASQLVIDVADAPPGDRDFDVTVTVDGEDYACSGVIGAEGLFCDGIEIFPTDTGYTVTVNLPPAEGGAPVHLTLGWDGTVAVDDDLDVTWGEPFAPNGEGCDPVCTSGEAVVEIQGS